MRTAVCMAIALSLAPGMALAEECRTFHDAGSTRVITVSDDWQSLTSETLTSPRKDYAIEPCGTGLAAMCAYNATDKDGFPLVEVTGNVMGEEGHFLIVDGSSLLVERCQ